MAATGWLCMDWNKNVLGQQVATAAFYNPSTIQPLSPTNPFNPSTSSQPLQLLNLSTPQLMHHPRPLQPFNWKSKHQQIIPVTN